MCDEKISYVFIWHIENFYMCPLETKEKFDSPMFKAENLGGSEWFLRVYPRGHDERWKNIAVYLHRVKNDNNEDINYSLEMIGKSDELLMQIHYENAIVTHCGHGFRGYLPAYKLLSSNENCFEAIVAIRCKITSVSKLMNQPASESVAQTKFGVDRCCFTWNVDIPDSSMWKRKKAIFLSKKSQFTLTLSAPDDDIEIEIRKANESQSQVVACKISLINIKGISAKSYEARLLLTKSEACWKFPKFITLKDIQAGSENVMQDRTYTLDCKVSASNGENFSEVLSVKYEVASLVNVTSFSDSPSALVGDLRNLLNSHTNSDVILRVENVLIPAHKLILSARSPVFKAMFEQNMLEKKTGTVDIKDSDAMTMNHLIEFIYTEFVNGLDFDNAMKLLVVADKYQVVSLIAKCADFLKSNLTIENVFDVYSLSDMISHKDLKSSAQKFIKINSVKVLESLAWSIWMAENVKLANEILFKLAVDCSKLNFL